MDNKKGAPEVLVRLEKDNDYYDLEAIRDCEIQSCRGYRFR
jgi:hypothetical protein